MRVGCACLLERVREQPDEGCSKQCAGGKADQMWQQPGPVPVGQEQIDGGGNETEGSTEQTEEDDPEQQIH